MKASSISESDRQLCERIGFVAGVMFAVHPIHVESVANITGMARGVETSL